MSSQSSPIDEMDNRIPMWEAVLLITMFAVLYMYVIPKLFPSVVSGSLVIDPAKLSNGKKWMSSKKSDENEEQQQRMRGGSGGEGGVESRPPLEAMESFVVAGGGMGFATGHRTQAKAQLRRRQTEERKAYMV
jgi:hypothetical protein